LRLWIPYFGYRRAPYDVDVNQLCLRTAETGAYIARMSSFSRDLRRAAGIVGIVFGVAAAIHAQTQCPMPSLVGARKPMRTPRYPRAHSR
jgi:hypothetical protein